MGILRSSRQPADSLRGVLITGASSGLGAALALVYAQEGAVLFLAGRQEARLADVADRARAQGAQVYETILDVTEAEATERWIEACDAIAPLDLVIANAGISAGTGGGEETPAQVRAIFGVNLHGVLNTVLPASRLMKARGAGQIAIMSSLAGFVGIAGAPAYGASKAAVRIYGEALRGELAPHGVKVNVICPGFIKTPMTDVNPFPMPFLMDAQKAARIIRRGLARNLPRIAFPWPMAAVVFLLTLMPVRLRETLLRRLPRKP